MPKKKEQTLSLNEVVKQLADGLKGAAISPNIYGYRPHPRQKLFHEASQWGRLFLGGNRSGKTVGGATETVWRLLGKHPYQVVPPPPVFLRAVSVDFVNGVEKIIKPEIAKWLPKSELLGGSWSSAYDGYTRTLQLENGSKLEFMSYDQDLDKFAGTSRHGTWFDEEPPKPIFNECRARLIDVNGKWWMTMTPIEGMTWVYDDIYSQALLDPNLFVIEIDMAENPYINTAEREMFLSGLSDEEKKIRGEGKFVAVGGLIYKHFGEKNLLPLWRPSPDEKFLWVRAMDHGFNNPTAWLFSVVNPEGDITVFDEYYEREKVISYHARAVIEREREYGAEFAYSVGDPSIANRNPHTGLSVQQEYMEYGVPIMLGENDVSAGIIKTARYIGGKFGIGKNQITVPTKLYVTRNCTNFLHEIQRYRWASWANRKIADQRNVKEEPNKKDDHCMDALRYLIASRPDVDTGQQPAPRLDMMGLRSAGVEFSEAVNPYAPTVAVFDNRKTSYSRDFNLGEEW